VVYRGGALAANALKIPTTLNALQILGSQNALRGNTLSRLCAMQKFCQLSPQLFPQSILLPLINRMDIPG